MSDTSKTSPGRSRRSFLGGTLAAGAGLSLFAGDASGPARLEWCARPAFPQASRTVWLVRGALPATVAQLELWLAGPGLESTVIARQELTLDRAVTSWVVRLDYAHTRLVAGDYRFWPVARVGTTHLVGPETGYAVNPFTFGV
ncbi:MAG: hypothetical protein ACI9WU_002840 [Myxococcota bacterium]|jgi:hypothetical protein